MVLVAALSAGGWAADGIEPEAGQPSGPSYFEKSGASSAAEGRLARVTGWIRERAPACPPDAMVSAAQKFLEELHELHPDQEDRLLSEDFPARDVEPALCRQIAAQLKGPQWAALREELARRRVEGILVREGSAGTSSAAEAAGLIEKIKGASGVQFRRLLEGRMEEDDLARLLKKTRAGDSARKAPVSEQARVLTAADIVSEFSRRNQNGAALQRWRAYTVEARLKTSSGQEQRLLLFRMRPDQFRLAVVEDGSTRLVVAGDGREYWQQVPGRPPEILTRERIGTRRYMGEFINPLFSEEGFAFERLADGASGAQKVYRIAVRRADGSTYVSQIDMDGFFETGREEGGRSTRYSDFRQIAGVTFAFREEATDSEGRKGTLELIRVTPNPGLIQDFFKPEAQGGQSYFAVEQLMTRRNETETK